MKIFSLFLFLSFGVFSHSQTYKVSGIIFLEDSVAVYSHKKVRLETDSLKLESTTNHEGEFSFSFYVNQPSYIKLYSNFDSLTGEYLDVKLFNWKIFEGGDSTYLRLYATEPILCSDSWSPPDVFFNWNTAVPNKVIFLDEEHNPGEFIQLFNDWKKNFVDYTDIKLEAFIYLNFNEKEKIALERKKWLNDQIKQIGLSDFLIQINIQNYAPLYYQRYKDGCYKLGKIERNTFKLTREIYEQDENRSKDEFRYRQSILFRITRI